MLRPIPLHAPLIEQPLVAADQAATAGSRGVNHKAGTPVLAIKGLRVSFPSRQEIFAVRGLSLQVNAGEILGLVGESGSGKSVTALATMRLLPRNARVHGSIELDGADLLVLSDVEMQAIRGSRIGMVFQDPFSSLDPVMSVGDQIVEVVRRHERSSRQGAEARAIDLLGRVGIPDARRRVRSYPHEFSGGMRQRVMVAIAISCRPELLLADEPTTALDVTVQAQVMDLLRTLRADSGMAILLISHNLALVAEIADRVVVAYSGGVVEEGPVREITTNPRHPYTQGLLASVPRLDRPRGERLPAIPGQPPIATAPEQVGCPFRDRCRYAIPRCAEENPRPFQVGPAHTANCFVLPLPGSSG